MRQDDRADRRLGVAAGRWLLLALVVATIGWQSAACSSHERRGTPATYDRNVIAEEELAKLEERLPVLHAVQRLRPAWLRGRGQTRQGSDSEVVVYINNQRAGGPTVLGRWTNADVRELHYLDPVTATQRFGTGHGSGAILLVLR